MLGALTKAVCLYAVFRGAMIAHAVLPYLQLRSMNSIPWQVYAMLPLALIAMVGGILAFWSRKHGVAIVAASLLGLAAMGGVGTGIMVGHLAGGTTDFTHLGWGSVFRLLSLWTLDSVACIQATLIGIRTGNHPRGSRFSMLWLVGSVSLYMGCSPSARIERIVENGTTFSIANRTGDVLPEVVVHKGALPLTFINVPSSNPGLRVLSPTESDVPFHARAVFANGESAEHSFTCRLERAAPKSIVLYVETNRFIHVTITSK